MLKNEITSIKVCHVEIPVLNLEDAKDFYLDVFGWKVDTKMMPDNPLANANGSISVGMPFVEKIPENFSGIYFHIEDINEVLKAISNHNGMAIQEKLQISPEIGYAVKFRDCFGNTLGLFSPS